MWREHRAANPARSPNVLVGREAIRAFLEGVAAAPLDLAVSQAVVRSSRVAYALTATFGDGRTILEHVIAELRAGRIVSQVDVEAWD